MMRCFDVTVDGAIHMIRAHDFRRPSETPTNEWEFVDDKGKVLWHYEAERVSSVIEGVKLESVGQR